MIAQVISQLSHDHAEGNSLCGGRIFASQKTILTAPRRFRRHFGEKTAAPSRKVIFGAVTNFRKTGNTQRG